MSHPLYPETANNAEQGDDGRQFAPSTPRNKGPILDLLQAFLGPQGRYLEIASGTGEHVVHFATNLPGWQFLPTENDPGRLSSIQAWIDHSGLSNIAEPQSLDAAQPGWGQTHQADAIGICNLFHLISIPQAQTVVAECAQALRPGGTLMIYGPFLRGGESTSAGDQRFHQSLIARDPNLGYKDDFDMLDWLTRSGLNIAAVVEMPANNLGIVAIKPA